MTALPLIKAELAHDGAEWHRDEPWSRAKNCVKRRMAAPWAQPNQYLGMSVLWDVAVEGGCPGRVVGWRPAAESEYYPAGKDQPPQVIHYTLNPEP